MKNWKNTRTTLLLFKRIVPMFIEYWLLYKLSANCMWVIFLLLLPGTFNLTLYAQFKYPFARKESFDTVIYQMKLSDEYSWMSRRENEEEMLEFAKIQGKFTEDILDSITGTELLNDVLNEIDASFRRIFRFSERG